MLATRQGGLVDRMVGAALLEDAVYEEVKHDRGATRQAVLVVAMAALAAGIGGLRGGGLAFLLWIFVALAAWAAYAYVAHYVATRYFKKPDTAEAREDLLRTLGFASSPRLLLFLRALPVLGSPLTLVVLAWTLITTVVALRHAFELDTRSAILTAGASWLALFLVSYVLGELLNSLIT